MVCRDLLKSGEWRLGVTFLKSCSRLEVWLRLESRGIWTPGL